jgi:hypothetical protein
LFLIVFDCFLFLAFFLLNGCCLTHLTLQLFFFSTPTMFSGMPCLLFVGIEIVFARTVGDAGRRSDCPCLDEGRGRFEPSVEIRCRGRFEKKKKGKSTKERRREQLKLRNAERQRIKRELEEIAMEDVLGRQMQMDDMRQRQMEKMKDEQVGSGGESSTDDESDLSGVDSCDSDGR